jgi:hypothetical protein
LRAHVALGVFGHSCKRLWVMGYRLWVMGYRQIVKNRVIS